MKSGDITIKDIFIKFLSENDAYLNFLVNVYDQGNENYSLEEVMYDVSTDPDVIGGAFMWSLTDEGHEFWRDLNERWYEIKTNWDGGE